MEFRKATEADVEEIMGIIRQAQAYFHGQGIPQWQNGYPSPEIVRSDIQNGYGFVLTEAGSVVGIAAVSFDGEETYREISGSWLSGGDYAVIHRVAVEESRKGRGLSAEVIRETERMCRERGASSVRVDTHEQNRSMQRMLQKNGFSYCGVIALEDGSPRVAFEKLL